MVKEIRAIEKVIKPFFAEGSEELNGNILDRTIDSWLAGHPITQEKFETVYKDKISKGSSKADAFFSAWWDSSLKEDTETFYTAGIQGILLGGGVNLVYHSVNAANIGSQVKENNMLGSYINAGLKLPQGSSAYNFAANLQEKVNSNKNISNFTIGNYVNEFSSQIKSQAAQRLSSLGEKGNIDVLSDAISKLSSAQSLTKEELLAISDNKNAQAVLKEMTGQLTGGQNIDSVNSNSVNVQNKSQSRLSGSESYALGVTDEEIQRYKDNGDSMYAKYVEGLRDNARIEDGKQIERAAIEKQFPPAKLQELARNGDYDTISFVNAKLKALDKQTNYSADNSFYKNLSIENSKRNAASQNNSAVITAMPQYAKTRVGADSAEGSIGSQLGNITDLASAGGSGNGGTLQTGNISTTGSPESGSGSSVTTPNSETISPNATNTNNVSVDGKNSGEYNNVDSIINGNNVKYLAERISNEFGHNVPQNYIDAHTDVYQRYFELKQKGLLHSEINDKLMDDMLQKLVNNSSVFSEIDAENIKKSVEEAYQRIAEIDSIDKNTFYDIKNKLIPYDPKTQFPNAYKEWSKRFDGNRDVACIISGNDYKNIKLSPAFAGGLGRTSDGTKASSNFVMSIDDAESCINCSNDFIELAGKLGLNSTKYRDYGGAYLIKIKASEISNIRYSTVDTLGSNLYWSPGLMTSGGQYEAVISRLEDVLNNKNVTIVKIEMG